MASADWTRWRRAGKPQVCSPIHAATVDVGEYEAVWAGASQGSYGCGRFRDHAVSQVAGVGGVAIGNASVQVTHSLPVFGRGCLVFRCREDAKPLLWPCLTLPMAAMAGSLVLMLVAFVATALGRTVRGDDCELAACSAVRAGRDGWTMGDGSIDRERCAVMYDNEPQAHWGAAGGPLPTTYCTRPCDSA